MSSRGLEAVLRYLVTHRLAGNDGIVEAVYDLFVENRSPIIVARRWRIPRGTVSGIKNRIIEFCNGDWYRARAIVRHVAPLVMEIPKVVVDEDDATARCRICGHVMLNDRYRRYSHVKRIHSGVVESYINRIIDSLVERYGRR